MAEQPSYTQVPNVILDALPALSEPELRVLLVVARKTIGWQKECDPISLTQFEQLTGLSRPAVFFAVKRACEQGWLEKAGSGKRGTVCYKLGDGLVNVVNQLTTLTSKRRLPDLVNDVNRSSPGLVNDVNTQKKDSKEKKERGERAKRATPKPAKPEKEKDATLDHLAVVTYRATFKRWPNAEQRQAIIMAVTDNDLWSDVCALWKTNRWDYLKVENLISRYQKNGKGTTNGTRSVRSHSGQDPERAQWTTEDNSDIL